MKKKLNKLKGKKIMSICSEEKFEWKNGFNTAKLMHLVKINPPMILKYKM